ncbi:hypothetical protein B0T11DRAFT_287291 [Plectosphaerella cucumerina]|uniref:Uncharacterized protein n=1 Tax=Plectosphaerella cucumerina TaxID=40658 RepID=A0A8K0TE12_9PEZI|nr:hypothetical protein B0T11DRAFT_287291 [Plectosphaerella cucumerina]
MKGRPVDQLVYECLFPKARASDPPNFHALLQRSLIPEVRSEVHSFYGHIDTHEAKYPGLDYTNRIHRIRLSRWTWHRRLFRAFDTLALTPSEIANLTKWEGTLWAKERFEKEQGIVIKDTAADGFPDWVEPEDRIEVEPNHVELEQADLESSDVDDVEIEEEEEDEEDSEDEEIHSVGTALNNRLRERVARRQAGETDTPLDEEWEQWLKNFLETTEWTSSQGAIPRGADGEVRQVPQNIVPAQVLAAGRAGRWADVPSYLHTLVRCILDGSVVISDEATAPASPSMPPLTRAPAATPAARESYGGPWRRTWSALRPAGDSIGASASGDLRTQRTAGAPGA